MIYHALRASQFRNLEQVSFSPHPRFNVLHGDNGQGKTNILEAIYLLATLRSFRTTRTEELIGFAHTSAELRARVEHRQVIRQLGLQLLTRPTRKQALVDGKAARTSEYFGGVNVVLFAPEDLRLPKGPPVGRRRFLDRAIWNTYPAYLDEVRTYERVLRSRNALLRSGPGSGARGAGGVSKGAPGAAYEAAAGTPHKAAAGTAYEAAAGTPSQAMAGTTYEAAAGTTYEAADGTPYEAQAGVAGMLSSEELLDIYDQKLAEAGAVLLQRRRHYIGELAPQVAATFTEVCRTDLAVELRYLAGVGSARQAAALSPATDLKGLLREQLQRDRRRDFLRGYTHSGPHADDLALDLAGRAADLHASQGQLRALVLSLKIAEIQHLYRILQDPPVLLLDDVSSELDPQRNAYLFEFLRTMPCQVFITTTSPLHVKLIEDRQDFLIRGGRIEEDPGPILTTQKDLPQGLPGGAGAAAAEKQRDA
ncbi:MAG TPA: DNA replication/repair protein RecF [Pseudomonadota bacterium]|nr:DNA replication/repair protein RecF [Pseudomonadota bacterium]